MELMRVNKNSNKFSSSRLYHDDPSIVYQLQIEICGSFTLAYDDLQGNNILTANIFESGPMPTPWKFLDRPPLLPSCKLG